MISIVRSDAVYEVIAITQTYQEPLGHRLPLLCHLDGTT